MFLSNCDNLVNKSLISNRPPSIIILTEIFPKHFRYTLDVVTYSLTDYELFISKIGEGRGVVIYIHKSIQANNIQIENCDFQESKWCYIRLNKKDKLLIGAIYRSPNSTAGNNDSSNQLMKIASTLPYSHVLIAGDFNYKEINWEDLTTSVSIEHDSTVFLESIRDSGLFQHVKQPTRFRHSQSESTLDLIFTNEEGMVENVEYLPGIGASDHAVIIFKLRCYTPRVDSSSPKPNFFKCDYDAMRESLAGQVWDINIEIAMDDLWNMFTEKINGLIKDFVPSKKCKHTYRNLWMTPETASTIDRKRRAWIKYLNCKSDENHRSYVKARNDTTEAIRYAKSDYERKISEKCKDEPKLFWNYVRSNTKTRDQIGDLRNTEGHLTDNPKSKADILNSFFGSVFTTENTDNIPDLAQKSTENLCDIIITPDMVRKKNKIIETV